MQPESSEITSTAILGYLDHLSPNIGELFPMLGLMGWPLVGCAIVTLAIILERFVFFTHKFATKKHIKARFSATVDTHKNLPKDLRDEAVSMTLIEAQKSFQNGVGLLRTISVISTMLGLLGTILGIIASFKVIAVQKGPVSPSLIADGLWEAMLTTAVGLMIALPALMAAYIFKYIAGNYLHNMGAMLNKLSMEYAISDHQQDLERKQLTSLEAPQKEDVKAA